MDTIFSFILILIVSILGILLLIGELYPYILFSKRSSSKSDKDKDKEEPKTSLTSYIHSLGYKSYQPPAGEYGPYKWMIKKKKWWIFWKLVYDPNKMLPYYFDTKKEADNFIINSIVGKSRYREERFEKLLDRGR